MLAILTGLPGCGKTTIAKLVLEELEKRGLKFELLNYGDVMFELASELKLVKHRDEMRKLNPSQQRKLQLEAAKLIARKASERSIILDTHCTISTPKGYLPGLPEWVLKELRPELLILVEAEPEEIVERRLGDKGRCRDEELVEHLHLQQQLNRSIAMSYAALTGAVVKIVRNPKGKAKEAAEEMLSAFL